MQVTAKGANKLVKSVARAIENRGSKTALQVAESAIASGLGFETHQAMLATLEREFQAQKAAETVAAVKDLKPVKADADETAIATTETVLLATLCLDDDEPVTFDAAPLVKQLKTRQEALGLFAGQAPPRLDHKLATILSKQGVNGRCVDNFKKSDLTPETPIDDYAIKFQKLQLRHFIEKNMPKLWKLVCTNHNSIPGMLCSDCGSDESFLIDGDGWDDAGSYDAGSYDRNGDASCLECGHEAPTCEFFGEELARRRITLADRVAPKLKELVADDKRLAEFLEYHVFIADQLSKIL